MPTASTPCPADVTHAVVALAALCGLFALKHLIADFLLQTTWMARGKERQAGWLGPLGAHVACHAALTLLIVLVLAPRLWWLAAIDFLVHIAVDRCKTTACLKAALRIEQPQFWWLLGLDQFLHQATNIGLAVAIVVL